MRSRIGSFETVLATVIVLAMAPAAAQENDECLLCHAEPELTGERGGREISVHVPDEVFSGSVHGDLECVLCHQDLLGSEMGHDDEVEPVDCSLCHDDQAAVESESLHGLATARGDELAPTCANCHGTHDILRPTNPDSRTYITNIPLMCGQCHREGSPVSREHQIDAERVLENYSMSIHGEGLFQQGLTVTAVCTSCHTAHDIRPHEDERSTIHHDNVARTCARCHGNIERVHRKIIEGRLWREEPNKIPACVDCHSPHRIRRVFYPAGLANQDCLGCHADPNLVAARDGEVVSMYVDGAIYGGGAHATTACAQCHTDVDASLERPCEPSTGTVDCAVCHAQQVDDHRSSTHGRLVATGDPDAPACVDCHTKHATQKKDWPSSPTFPRNVPELCAGCHRAGEPAAVRIARELPDVVQGYADSIHGKGLVQSGLLVTATCADCHSAHRELPPDDPASTVHPSNVADTCGHCHHGIQETFAASIHSPLVARSGENLPSCDGCHSSHTISRTDNVDFRFRMMDQCGRCHEEQSETFFDTFHGKVSRLGSSVAAKCSDCHGTHNILPASNVDSTLHREHVVDTCGQCHEGSHRQFAGYLTHATHHDPDRYPWLFWSFWGMTVLLIGTLTFALLHTLAWLVRLWLTRDEWRAHRELARSKKGEKLYRRFNRFQRTLHLLMILSFFTLALTGMALKFSYMGWAQWISWALGGFASMGVLHRMGAVVLFGIAVFHFGDVLRRKRRSGQTWLQIVNGPESILFNGRDLKELLQSIRWFFGLGARPRYGRFTYWEKFDYFAVTWGVLIIGSTGLVLWFPEFFTYLVPGWSINVATIIHSDEALLAVGFIFTVHFFNTHFRPDKFPMDPVIFTGRVTLDELKYDKPGEYERLMAGGAEQRLVKPFPQAAERAFKVFGFVALGVGLTLIALIVYAMLFGYR